MCLPTESDGVSRLPCLFVVTDITVQKNGQNSLGHTVCSSFVSITAQAQSRLIIHLVRHLTPLHMHAYCIDMSERVALNFYATTEPRPSSTSTSIYALPAHRSRGLVSIQFPAASTIVQSRPCVNIDRAIDTPSLLVSMTNKTEGRIGSPSV